ncbi:MAG: tetratricopeptide repeat protein [Ferruginibacter sp.]
METIKIFLASSEELKDDREAFKSFIDTENKILQHKGVFIYLDIWEDFIDAMSPTRLQDEYNKAVQSADIFVMLFSTKVGKYTNEEFDIALEKFKRTGKPFIYTYFKNANVEIDDIDESELKSLKDFQKKLDNLGHFYTKYKITEQLILHFKQQLDKLNKEGYINLSGNQNLTKPATNIPICLSAGQPSVTADFIGRDIELADVKEKLTKHSMLLINAEGGMGKTTLAAKFLEDNLANYTHYAWLFCDAGIIEQFKTLASPLGIDLSNYATEEEQLLAIKTKLENIGKNCLLVLDNINEPKHIEELQKYFGGLHIHIIITSRCQDVLHKKEYTLNHLEPEIAKEFFKIHYDEKTEEFEKLLDKFLVAIGYNTLMIELFSKNLHELSALGETLETILKHFEKEGLYLGSKSFEIQTEYISNVRKQAASTDDIINAIYDLTKLDEPERYYLVNLALLPAESHPLKILLEAFIQDDNIAFTKLLINLAKKGWLNTDTISYRMNPVIQQIVLTKNRMSLHNDAEHLISNVSDMLKHAGGSLVNLKNYQKAQPFAVIAQSLSIQLLDESFEMGMLIFNLSEYYKGIGDFISSIRELELATNIFKKNSTENYSVCLERFGDIYQKKGDFKKALQFFEKNNELSKELVSKDPHSESNKRSLAVSFSRLGEIYEDQGDFRTALQLYEKYNELAKELVGANPNKEEFKNGLAISYEKFGGIYEQLGDFKKALQFFEKETELMKELVDANPHSESLKNGLAISYERSGEVYKKQKDFGKALQFFEKFNRLMKELADTNPHSESLKYGHAVSYSKLGEIYEEQKNFKISLQFFEQDNELMKELVDANPYSESLKNGLAVSYSKLGNIYKLQGDFKKALELFEQDTELSKELFEANPDSVLLYNGLAISFSKLGTVYKEMHEPKKMKDNYLKAEVIWAELTKKVPEAIEFANNLAWIQSKLAGL